MEIATYGLEPDLKLCGARGIFGADELNSALNLPDGEHAYVSGRRVYSRQPFRRFTNTLVRI